MPPVVRAYLRPGAADRHRTPRPGPVPRVVVEDPMARIPGAGLHAAPSAADHLVAHDRHDPGERLIETIDGAVEAYEPVGIDARDEPEACQLTGQGLPLLRRHRMAVVGQGHRPHQLAKRPRPFEVVLVEPGTWGRQIVPAEP